ncbi:MAG: primosomal protein N', partial [Deltaproteobacteria bacterium]|nr:primosomal protein N' [Deltaproteobacteria bacterium]
EPGPPSEAAMTLAPEQEEAVAALAEGIAARSFLPYLLHGVTASGKTEVYLRAAAATLAQERQVLVLLPEIALTHPVAREFGARFGRRVSLLHSGLSDVQRLAQWRRLAAGEVDLAVGARSAVFAPLPRLGLIVVDEEHDPSYKHEGGLPYQARDVALYRGKLAGAAVVLVSATPSLGAYYRAQKGDYRYLQLSRRVTPQALPDISLVDLKRERGGKDFRVISRPLAAALEEVLGKGEQALLFLNRRGYATALFCLFCGEVRQCPDCSVALTQHRARGLLQCHYCGHTEPVPDRCPACQSGAVKHYGVGTERVEAELARLFPGARVGRLDRDTAPHSGRALSLLEDFGAGRVDLLVGTQMVTKGHHFPGVTLVGVIAADLSLHFPEYHAGERTFQLLAQVAGRAGRGEAPGRVIIQTYHPEHYVFRNLINQDYQGFYDEEAAARQTLGYPPFTRLALVRLSGPDEALVAREAARLGETARDLVRRDPELASRLRVLGPAPAGLAKLKGRHRWQLLVKSCGLGPRNRLLERLRKEWRPPPGSRLDLTLDIDPAKVW